MLSRLIDSPAEVLERRSHPCPAKALGPEARLDLAVAVLARSRSVTALAAECDVSRKFVYQQAGTARAALDGAFSPRCPDRR